MMMIMLITTRSGSRRVVPPHKSGSGEECLATQPQASQQYHPCHRHHHHHLQLIMINSIFGHPALGIHGRKMTLLLIHLSHQQGLPSLVLRLLWHLAYRQPHYRHRHQEIFVGWTKVTLCVKLKPENVKHLRGRLKAFPTTHLFPTLAQPTRINSGGVRVGEGGGGGRGSLFPLLTFYAMSLAH